MTWNQFFTSSIGKKFLMGLTGLFLICFLIIHVGANACIFVNDHGEIFNIVAHFMSHNWILRILEIGLFAGLFLHIIQGLLLWKQNRSARPVGYTVSAAGASSTWYSRSMGLLGSLLLIFLVVHISKFFVNTKIALYSGDQPNNLYEEMQAEFSRWWIVVVYLVGVIALFWHLLHGFQSAFQTFGLNHKRYTPIIRAIGIGYTIIVSLLFALMPLAMFLKWLD